MRGPKDYDKPSAFVLDLLRKAKSNYELVDLPLYDENGDTVSKVHMRTLSQHEEDLALANAANYVARLMNEGKELPWEEEELRHNSRCAEILAVACRDPDDPEKPFFRHGVLDTWQFSTNVLTQLLNVYVEIKERDFPGMREIVGRGDLEQWVKGVVDGSTQHPFAYMSPSQLTALMFSLAGHWVEDLEKIEKLTSSSGGDSEKPHLAQ